VSVHTVGREHTFAALASGIPVCIDCVGMVQSCTYIHISAMHICIDCVGMVQSCTDIHISAMHIDTCKYAIV